MNLFDRGVLYLGVPLAVIFSLLVLLHLHKNVPPPQQGKLLSINNTILIRPGASCGDGTNLCCTEDGSFGVDGSGNAYVNAGDIVQWVILTGNVTSVDVKFANTSSPFFDLPNNSSTVTAGMPISSAPSNTTWAYQSVTWNNGSASCKNVLGSGIGPLGIIMRPPQINAR